MTAQTALRSFLFLTVHLLPCIFLCLCLHSPTISALTFHSSLRGHTPALPYLITDTTKILNRRFATKKAYPTRATTQKERKKQTEQQARRDSKAPEAEEPKTASRLQSSVDSPPSSFSPISSFCFSLSFSLLLVLVSLLRIKHEGRQGSNRDVLNSQ